MNPCSVCSLKGQPLGLVHSPEFRKASCILQKGLRGGLVPQLRVCSGDGKADGSDWSIFSQTANYSWTLNWCSHLNTGDEGPSPIEAVALLTPSPVPTVCGAVVWAPGGAVSHPCECLEFLEVLEWH